MCWPSWVHLRLVPGGPHQQQGTIEAQRTCVTRRWAAQAGGQRPSLQPIQCAGGAPEALTQALGTDLRWQRLLDDTITLVYGLDGECAVAQMLYVAAAAVPLLPEAAVISFCPAGLLPFKA